MKKIIPFIFVLILFLLPTLLNIPLKNYFNPGLKSQQEDLIYRMFGSLRGLLADWAFMKGEEYYHGGLNISNIDVSECMQEEMREHRSPEKEHSHEEHHHHDSEYENFKPAGINDNFYLKIYSQVKVIKHIHLSYSAEKEVLPWFYLEVKFNPYDIQGYLFGSFWFAREGKTEEAFKFLLEGEKNNPTSAQIQGAIGEIYYKQNKIDEAIPYLERSTKLWLEKKSPNLADDNYSFSDRGYAFDLLAESYLKEGKKDKAKETLMQLYSLDPERKILLERIRKI